jgi:predicted SprT family Zn-dependent metalloprotease
MGPITLMQAKSKCSVIKIHVVTGQEGMQQGLAFNPSVLLLKTFLIFNGSVLHELIVHYAPHQDIQAYNTSN